MKKFMLSILVFFTLVLSNTFAQVKEIGISFSKKGFIQEVYPVQKAVVVNFIEENEIIEEVLYIVHPTSKQMAKGISTVEQLKSGMEITVEGEHFKKSKYSVATSITIKPIEAKAIDIGEGRIDGVKGEYAYIDGHRVKLKAGTIIQGEKPTNAKKGEKGYSNKTFGRFTELPLGDIAHVKGSCSAEGCYWASQMGVMPNEETESDEAAKQNMAEINAIHEQIYPIWTDSTQRHRLFGQPFIGGNITNNKTIQDFVSRVGESLIPEHARGTLKFMFVVVDNPNFNAFVLPTGLSVVNLGLFSYIENEAQLAAVLGHEIAHAIYEHGAKKLGNMEKAQKKKEGWGKLLRGIANATSTILPNTSKAVLGDNVVNSLQEGGALNTVFKTAASLKIDRELSNYSIDYELQSDRVGLFLMVQAGYDPREAPKIWRNIYNVQNPEKNEKGESVLSQTLNNAQGSNLEQIGKTFLGNVAKKKITEIHTKNQRTHPENMQRFVALNQFIEMYWSDPALLSKTRVGRAWK